MLKAVIFDMDGVIIDSEPLHARANILALKQFGIDLTLDYVYQFIGNTILSMCETIKKDYNLSIDAKELSAASAKQIEYLHSIEGYTPIPYIKNLIEDLYNHGIKLAIASSSTIELIQQIVDVLELKPYFAKLISGTSVTHSKPAPDIFLKACEELGVSTDEAIIIEDSKNGVLAATRANIPVIGYKNLHSGNQDLSLANIIVEGFDEVDYHFIDTVYCHAHNLPATILSTDRLIIREIGSDDIPQLYQLYQSPSFIQQKLRFSDTLEEAYEKHEAYCKHMYHFLGYGLWGVFLKHSDQLIGHCGIEPKDVIITSESKSILTLGYGILDAYHNQGYAKEVCSAILDYAKKNLYLDEMYAIIASENVASIHLIKWLDFSYTNTVQYLNDPKDLKEYQLYHKKM